MLSSVELFPIQLYFQTVQQLTATFWVMRPPISSFGKYFPLWPHFLLCKVQFPLCWPVFPGKVVQRSSELYGSHIKKGTCLENHDNPHAGEVLNLTYSFVKCELHIRILICDACNSIAEVWKFTKFYRAGAICSLSNNMAILNGGI